MLHKLLDRGLGVPPEYRAGLSNHLPMALHALDSLGADASRLESFMAGYIQRIGERGSTPPGFDATRAAYATSLRQRGRDATLRAALPALWPRAAGAAFHGLIRTAHAVQAGHDGELAAALAYWQARGQSVPAPDAAAVALPLDAWSAAIEAAAQGWRSDAGLIATRIGEVGQTAAYRRLAGALALGPGTLADLHRWAADLYAASGNFTVLHLVTGTRAVRVLGPWIDDAAATLRSVAPAIAAGALASGLGQRSAVEAPVLGWPEVVRRAIAQHDEHVVKLVHACAESAQQESGGPFLAAAERAVR